MKNLFFFLGLSLLFQINSKAQELPSIQTDRPDQTECPFITPKNYFQLENGFLDFVVERKNVQEKLNTLLELMKN